VWPFPGDLPATSRRRSVQPFCGLEALAADV
jgi:hypothetical protein